MKRHLITSSLVLLTLSACNLENVKSSEVQRLEAEKNVKELIVYLQKPNAFRADQAAEALGNLGDKQAVEPLIAVLKSPSKSYESSSQIKTRKAAAIALGKLQDFRAIPPLTAAVMHENTEIAATAKSVLKDMAAKNPKVVTELLPALKKDDAAGVAALGALGKPALEPMLAALKEPDRIIQANAVRALGNIGDAKAIKPLTNNLTNWYLSTVVGEALVKLNWQAVSDADKIHLLIAKGKGEDLRNNWQMTKTVLLKDLESQDPQIVKYALYSFISIGGKDAIATLTNALTQNGNKALALAYLNCGEPTLEKAAQDWATAQGYQVIKTEQKDQSPVKWGAF